MDKKVLVIEDWTEFLTVYGLSKKDGDCLIRDYGSLGKLLAEFEGEVVDLGSMGKDLAVADEDMEKLEGGKKYHVLILEKGHVPTKEGGKK